MVLGTRGRRVLNTVKIEFVAEPTDLLYVWMGEMRKRSNKGWLLELQNKSEIIDGKNKLGEKELKGTC